jgi:hypothetical protein
VPPTRACVAPKCRRDFSEYPFALTPAFDALFENARDGIESQHAAKLVGENETLIVVRTVADSLLPSLACALTAQRVNGAYVERHYALAEALRGPY